MDFKSIDIWYIDLFESFDPINIFKTIKLKINLININIKTSKSNYKEKTLNL